MAQPAFPEGIDFTDPDIYAERMPFEEFAELRKTAPVWWNPQPPEIGGFQDEGFWVVTRHEEVKEVSQRSDIFSTHENTAIPRFADDIPRENVEMQRFILINKDARSTPSFASWFRVDSPREPSTACAKN